MSTQAEKDAAKAAKQAEKDAAKAGPASDIEVGEPVDIRPKNLPLVIKLPASASSAQREFAKILNGYAYQNLEKWNAKKSTLLKQLECLADYEIPEIADDGEHRPNQNLELNRNGIKGLGSRFTFTFVKEKDGSFTPYAFPIQLIRKNK